MVVIPPETEVLGGAISEFRRYSRLPWSVLLRITLGRLAFHRAFQSFEMDITAVYRDVIDVSPENQNLAFVLNVFYRQYAAKHKPDAQRWGEKSPANTYFLDDIAAVFPGAFFIHMVRDGRDVVQSCLDWGRYTRIEDAAERWQTSVHAARKFGGRRPQNYLEVRYEQLVADPDAHVRRLADWLGLEFDPAMLEHHRTKRDLGDAHRNVHMLNVTKPITSSQVGRWQKAFSVEQVEQLARLLDPTLKELGYPATADVVATI